MPDSRLRVAIACQGGGSHTAFSAGALKRLLAAPQYDVVALSGTSGGAIDALLAWYGLLQGDRERIGERLEAFWDDMSASSLPDYVFNQWAVATHRALAPFFSPEVSPYLYPTWASEQLRAVIERHVDFARIPELVERRGSPIPMLLVGAVDVISGRFKVFKNEWAKGKPAPTLDVSAQAVLASAAIPTLFRAARVTTGGRENLYWDGLFSQNPPVRDLPAAKPDQIWVLQINPTERRAEPMEMAHIRDRRNELAGNLSLRQELHFIEKINKMVRGAQKSTETGGSTLRLVEVDAKEREETRSYKEITLFRVELEEDGLGFELDTESKLNRDPAFIRQLLACGERHAGRFLTALETGRGVDDYRWKDDGDDDEVPAPAPAAAGGAGRRRR